MVSAIERFHCNSYKTITKEKSRGSTSYLLVTFLFQPLAMRTLAFWTILTRTSSHFSRTPSYLEPQLRQVSRVNDELFSMRDSDRGDQAVMPCLWGLVCMIYSNGHSTKMVIFHFVPCFVQKYLIDYVMPSEEFLYDF